MTDRDAATPCPSIEVQALREIQARTCIDSDTLELSLEALSDIRACAAAALAAAARAPSLYARTSLATGRDMPLGPADRMHTDRRDRA
jgi:hypothetical protein